MRITVLLLLLLLYIIITIIIIMCVMSHINTISMEIYQEDKCQQDSLYQASH